MTTPSASATTIQNEYYRTNENEFDGQYWTTESLQGEARPYTKVTDREMEEKMQHIVYIDTSGQGSNQQTLSNRPEHHESTQTTRATETRNTDPNSRMDEILTSVVYIDQPEEGPSTHYRPQNMPEEPEYLQNTILYDPFKGSRIPMPSEDVRNVPRSLPLRPAPDAPAHSSRSSPISTVDSRNASRFVPIDAPSGSSSNPHSIRTATPANTSTIQSPIFQPLTPSDDGFHLPPIPVTDHTTEPPPAYTEFDQRSHSHNITTVAQAATTPSPRPPETRLIVYNDNYRKYLRCHHCGNQVYTVVLKQAGNTTHYVALILCVFFCLFPLIVLVYYCDTFKHKNHYCPYCNELIGYETVCSKLVLVK